ncbi:hypothetical protein I4N56_030770 [Pseudomonas mohnii]|uniref:Cap15 family cyclic dinucleotide receptor domain-containing protein n=1 Tax=Pseudomonas mohnii TaxID=395600 RepID=UPI0018C7EA51|nr:hypothetical protein [Pseudomonas mohnii]MBH8614756.1 hypothetical protein [Pseudomonas mohnii]
MFLIIYPLRVIGVVAVAYCICVIGLHFLLSKCCPEYAPELFGMALRGGALLNFVLLVFVYWGWRRLWASFPALNSWLFPDLNGEWDMTIHYRNNGQSGEVRATAVIKQSWLSMSMEVLSQDSDSQTLAIVPKKDPESGRAQIFYFYRVIPKKTGVGAREPYEGSANLRFSEVGPSQLAGNYYTSVATDGYFKLARPVRNSESQ